MIGHKPSRDLFKNLEKVKHPPYIIADSIKAPENYGNIIRLADNIGCAKVFFLKGENEVRLNKIKRTAVSSYNSIDWEICESLDEILNQIPKDYKLIAIETHDTSQNIFTSNIPEKSVLVLGNEIHGVDKSLLEKCTEIYHIPVPGVTSSLNVTHALSVALFEWYRQNYFS